MSQDELLNLSFRLYEETNKMKHHFADLMCAFRIDLENVFVKDVAFYLASYEIQFDSILRNCVTIDALLLKVREYVSFFDYSLIENLISRFGSDETKKNLKTYNELFESFAMRRVSECPSDAFKESNVSKSERVGLLITEKFMSNLTIREVLKLKYEFNKILGNKLIEVLCVKGGSVTIIFRILVAGSFKVTKKQKSALRKSGVVCIKFHDSSIVIGKCL